MSAPEINGFFVFTSALSTGTLFATSVSLNEDLHDLLAQSMLLFIYTETAILFAGIFAGIFFFENIKNLYFQYVTPTIKVHLSRKDVDWHNAPILQDDDFGSTRSNRNVFLQIHGKQADFHLDRQAFHTP